jgi:hypothetical protein
MNLDLSRSIGFGCDYLSVPESWNFGARDVVMRRNFGMCMLIELQLLGRRLGTALELSSAVDAEAADSAAATEHVVQGRRRRGEEEGVQEG